MENNSPARKIKNYRCRKSIIGKFSSVKSSRTVEWESTLERDYAYLLEVDHQVTTFDSQPFTLTFYYEARRTTYTPDFFVIRAGVKQVIEVKPEKELDDWRSFFIAVAKACAKKGYEFIVVTETTIRQQPILYNARLLCRYRKQIVHPSTVADCTGHLRVHGVIPVFEAVKALRTLGIKPCSLYSLMFWGFILFDGSSPISDQTLIWV